MFRTRERGKGLVRFLLSICGAMFSTATTGLFALAAFGSAVFWLYGHDLPEHEQLAVYAPATVSRVYSTNGDVIDEFASERRIYTPIEEIPPLVKDAFVSAEDKEFYRHKGYDPIGMAKALVQALQGRKLRGASTITQQVMKNFLLTRDRSAERKIKELILATRIENTLTKDEILQLYLNEIFLGQNTYGVTAAAMTYFAKPLEELAVHEAAYLAGLPKAPSEYHPVHQRERAIARRNFVLKEMAENQYISQAEAAIAREKPLRTVQSGDIPSIRSERPPSGYFTDEIRRQLSRSFGESTFHSGGLVVRATKDPILQKAAETALRRGLERFDRNRNVFRGPVAKIDPEHLGTEENWRKALEGVTIARDIDGWHPAVVLDLSRDSATIGVADVHDMEVVPDHGPDTIPMSELAWKPLKTNGRPGPKAKVPGELLDVGDVIFVKAMTENGLFSHWSLRQVPEIQGAFMAMDANSGRVLAMQGGFSYQHSVFNRATQALRQPGSSFKPFVYAAALDSGFFPSTILIDAPFRIETPEGIWEPKNYSGEYFGPVPMRVGIIRSRNLMTVRLARDVGMETVANYAERFGVYDDLEPYLANSLGAKETTLYRMVAAYAMFANGGERVEPTLVDRVQDRWGTTIYRQDNRDCLGCRQSFLEPGTAPEINNERQRIMDRITAYQLTSMMLDAVRIGTGRGTIKLDFPVAGKTGTTNESKDTWFIGFTPNIVAGCYIGYDQPRSLGKKVTGAGTCGPVFTDFMTIAGERFGGQDFRVPPGGVFHKFDRFSGVRLSDDAEGENVVEELFRLDDAHAAIDPVVIDGGFAVGEDLLLVTGVKLPDPDDDQAGTPGDSTPANAHAAAGAGADVTVVTGRQDRAGDGAEDDALESDQGNASFGSLSSGGLY